MTRLQAGRRRILRRPTTTPALSPTAAAADAAPDAAEAALLAPAAALAALAVPALQYECLYSIKTSPVRCQAGHEVTLVACAVHGVCCLTVRNPEWRYTNYQRCTCAEAPHIAHKLQTCLSRRRLKQQQMPPRRQRWPQRSQQSRRAKPCHLTPRQRPASARAPRPLRQVWMAFIARSSLLTPQDLQTYRARQGWQAAMTTFSNAAAGCCQPSWHGCGTIA